MISHLGGRASRLGVFMVCALMLSPIFNGCVDTTICTSLPVPDRPEPAYLDSVGINDLDYIRDKYFFIRDPLAGEWSEDPPFSELTVYLDDGNGTNNETSAFGYAFRDPLDLPEEDSWDTLAYRGYFDTLAPNEDYWVNLWTGQMYLASPLLPPHHLAVTYLYGEQAVGGRDEESRLILKMIRPSDSYVIERGDVWKAIASQMMRRNIYSLGAQDIGEEVDISIFRREPDVDRGFQREHPYSKILGLDLRDGDGVLACEENGWATDSLVDPSWIVCEQGLLLFPDVRPFAPTTPPAGRPETLEVTVPRIYDEHPANLRPGNDSKYYMIVRYNPIHKTARRP
ncbi:hypothetical protein ACFL2Z_01200 [Candidatus Eisenbacteria bacterium]|uniref:Uncharacterized protein n=1 Tax=Eiseniibacteriota bacterium TaxID=2212470 RepID=A0ABV6YN61_UNCEI